MTDLLTYLAALAAFQITLLTLVRMRWSRVVQKARVKGNK